MSDMKNRYYEWTNEVFAASPFDLKTNNLLSLVAALMAGNPGAINYFHGAARKAGATEAELAAVADLAVAASGLNLYALWPKE